MSAPDLVDEDSPEWCPHFGDGTPKSRCSKCNGSEKIETQARAAVAYTFPAQFSSTLRCGHAVTIGEMIVRTADERIVCEPCARTEARP